MIKRIFLHIGIHKTASSTIQSTFYKERSKLLDYGVLYPVFKVRKNEVFNHSIPFYSLFMEHPETFIFNIEHGFTSNSTLEKLHRRYRQQFREQINTFNGEALVISGEDISLLKVNELNKLKMFILHNTHPDVNINIVLICRHPVSWFRSALQMNVAIYGNGLDDEVKNLLQEKHRFQNLIERFSKVFGADNFLIIKLEDAVKHIFGPAGAMFSLIQNDLAEKLNPQLIHENQGATYEAFKLLKAINNSYSRNIDYAMLFGRMKPVIKLFTGMPGQKFMLPRGLSIKAWEALGDDANWLCKKFSLPVYQFRNEDLNVDAWSRQTLYFVRKNLTRLTRKQRVVILLELLKEIFKTDCGCSFTKRIKIAWFVLSNTGKIILPSKK